MAQFTIGGLTFQSDDAVTLDSNGVYWGLSSTTGWYDLPSMRLFNTPLPRNSGLFRSTSYKGGRTIVINGWLTAPTMAARETARVALLGMPFLGGELTLTVTDVLGSLSCAVELVDLKAVPSGPVSVDFQLTLQARDPRKYAAAVSSTAQPASATGGLSWPLDWSTGGGLNWGVVTSTGQATVVNTGTADSWPVFVLAANGGTLTNPTIVDQATGNLLAFNLVLSGSDQLVVTTSPMQRSVLYNGVDRRSAMTSAQWWSVPANSTDTVSLGQSSYLGSPSLTMNVSPAFW